MSRKFFTQTKPNQITLTKKEAYHETAYKYPWYSQVGV